jgi:hypothetical protein
VAVVGQKHGRTEDVPRRVSSQPQAAPLDRLAQGEWVNGSFAAAKAIEGRGGGRAEGQDVPGHVVGVRVGNKSPRLAAAEIDRQIGRGQLEAAFVVKQTVLRDRWRCSVRRTPDLRMIARF